MGVVTDVIQKYLPANSSLTAAIVTSVPFGFILIALIFYVIRSGSLDEDAGRAGPLDEAIKPANQSYDGAADVSTVGRWPYLGLIPIALVGLMPFIFHGSAYWLGLTAAGLCYAVTFLNFTVVTGEGGMLWLAQIIFAGAGALATAQFANELHVPVLLAVVMGGLIAAAAGAIIGLLTIRLGDLYVALVTLTFGVLVETLVFTRNRFLQGGLGVVVNRPKFASHDLGFSYLAFAVFLVIALLTINLRRSTSGLALRAVRDSEPASRTLGLSVLQVKVIVGAIAAFVAAVGGGFLAMYFQVAQPQSYDSFGGLVWLAVVVALGARSIIAAIFAGMAFSVVPGLFQTYVPARWGEVPTMLFGLGAIGIAQNPEGAVLQNARLIRGGLGRIFPKRPEAGVPTPQPAYSGDGEAPATQPTAAPGAGVKAEAAQ
jgi:branched-chain amino acid transport system permease protein